MKKATLQASFAFVLAILLMAGCSHSTSTTNPLGTYYFTGTFLGQNVNYNAQLIQVGDNYQDVGGYVPNSNLSAAGGIFLNLHDTTPKARILALANTSYSFAPTATITPDVVVNPGNLNFYHTMSTTDPSYFLKINQIVYLKSDTLFGNPEDIYAVDGSFKAKMADPNTGAYAGDASGTFNIQCTAAHY